MPLTDELAEALTPDKAESGDGGSGMRPGLGAMGEGERQSILLRIAKVGLLPSAQRGVLLARRGSGLAHSDTCLVQGAPACA